MEHPSLSARNLEQDRALFERLKSDPRAIGELYDAYANKLYGFLLKRCAQKELAEDLVSHTFVKLLETRTSLEWKNVPLHAWLYQVASNALIDHFRKASTQRDLPLDTEEWDPPSAEDPAWNAQVVYDAAQIRTVMGELSARDQQVLDLKFFAELETQEIADVLQISSNHAAVLLYRALGRLRQKMQRHELATPRPVTTIAEHRIEQASFVTKIAPSSDSSQ